MTTDFSPYVPAKIRHLASSLLIHEDVDQSIDTLRSMYPKLCSFRTALSRLKAAVLEANPHHPRYAERMSAHEERLRRLFIETQDDDVLKRVQQFYAFRACSLKRQLQIQKKMELGNESEDGGVDTLFTHPDDVDFVLKLEIAPSYVRRIHLSDDETRSFVQQQMEQQRLLSESVVRIENADELVLRAREVLKDKGADVVSTAVALALVTGRRMVEIFQRGEFLEIPGRRYACLFSGQAKTGLRHIHTIETDQVISYDIPLLARVKHVKSAHDRMRVQAKSCDLHPKTINGMWCRKLNEHVKRTVHPELGFHDLRSLYALISFDAFKPHTFGINGWVSKVLGNGLRISIHYTRYQVFGINKIRRTMRESTEDYED